MAAGADRRLLDALADLVAKCAPYGERDGGFVFLYLAPTGPVHRAVSLLREHGVIVRPGHGRRFKKPEQQMEGLGIGRVVHYQSRGSADGVFPPTCRAAVVTEVGEDGRVGLCVQNPEGLFFHPLSRDGGVDYHGGNPVDGDGARRGGTWHWPERV